MPPRDLGGPDASEQSSATIREEDAGRSTTLQHDFRTFFVGQTLSSIGTAFTRFAIPLLVYQLTGSALSLAVTSALTFLPVVLFGLPIGVWADRVNRKHLMIGSDIARALTIAWLPILSSLHMLALGWIYAAAVLSSLLALCFETCQYAAVASLVRPDELMQANGRLQASYAVSTIMGSAVGGAALAVLALPTLLFVDAATFLVSAASLALTRTTFNDPHETGHRARGTLRGEMREGLSYVWRRPVLRNFLLLFVAINLVTPSVSAQLVALLKQNMRADDTQVGLFYAAGSLGVAVLSLYAGRVRRRFHYGTIVIGSLVLNGSMTIALALTHFYALATLWWAGISGLNALLNIVTSSIGQANTPRVLMGRVLGIVRMVAWAPVPLSTVAGGFLVERTHQVAPLYAAIGVLLILVGVAFSFTSLRSPDQHSHT